MTDQENHDELVEQARTKVSAARMFIERNKPVFAAVLRRVEIHIVTDRDRVDGVHVPTAMTDCHRNIWVSARFIKPFAVGGVVFVIMHELLHKMLKHQLRGTDFDAGLTEHHRHSLSNAAKDFIINSIVASEIGIKNFPLPPSDKIIYAKVDTFWDVMEECMNTGKDFAIMDTNITDDDTTESIIKRLIATIPPWLRQQQQMEQQVQNMVRNMLQQAGMSGSGSDGKQENSQGSGSGGAAQGEDDSTEQETQQGSGGNGEPDGPEQDKQQGSGGGTDKPENPEQEKQQGSGGQGNEQDDQDDKKDDPFDHNCFKDNDNAQPRNVETGAPEAAEDLVAEDARTGMAVAQALDEAGAKQIGVGSSRYKRVADSTIAPAINPRALLEKFVRRRTAKTDYSFRKLRRFGMANDMILPTLRSEELGELICVIDTSGSVGERELSQYLADIKAVIRIMKPTQTRVIYADSAVCGEQIFKRNRAVVLEPKGGGGTAFAPVFQQLKDEKAQANLLLYMTDGYAYDPNKIEKLQPPFPVVWLVYDGDPKFSASFGDVVHTKIRRD